MRPFKPAPKNAAANRIRERYLHQLGLQRGLGAPMAAPHPNDNQVVVISGLPSLPEDRATTMSEGHVMEAHDFGNASRQSQQTPSVDTSGDGSGSDCGSAHGGATNPNAAPHDGQSHCSKSTLSLSPNNVAGEAARHVDVSQCAAHPCAAAGDHLTSMALAYPTALRKRSTTQAMPPPPPVHGVLSFPMWRPSVAKPSHHLVQQSDSAAEYHRSGHDGDSVSSAGTCTTAESSLTATAAMVSRDWGAIPQPTAGASQGLGESPASAPGVYFQCGHPSLLHIGTGQPCGQASSLAHALNRFNIDSDCEASSVASNSIIEDHAHMMDEDEAGSMDDNASVVSHASHTSHTSVGSTKSTRELSSSLNSLGSQLSQGHVRARAHKKKIGMKQRLMDRAAAHERILQIRSDRSRNMRASLVQLQRMGNPSSAVPVSALSSAMVNQEMQVTPLSESPSTSSVSSAASLPLVHVQHGPANPNGCDLGRTPTASNCHADLRRIEAMGASPIRYLNSLPQGFLPRGVHNNNRGAGPGPLAPPPAAPLFCQPRLATRVPTPPPRLANGMLPSVLKGSSVSISTPNAQGEAETGAQSREAPGSSSLQHANHQATIDDVMDVAMTLSQLGERGSNPVPRIR